MSHTGVRQTRLHSIEFVFVNGCFLTLQTLNKYTKGANISAFDSIIQCFCVVYPVIITETQYNFYFRSQKMHGTRYEMVALVAYNSILIDLINLLWVSNF